MTAGRTLHDAAAAVGALRWSELQLYRVLGGWVATGSFDSSGADGVDPGVPSSAGPGAASVAGPGVASGAEPGDADDVAPGVDAMLDRHSQHAAWRAEQWWDRLPVLAGVDRDELVRPPAAEAEAMVAALGALEDGLSRLAGAYRVALPQLAASYLDLRASAAAVSEGPALRTLDRVEGDLWADWREGEHRLQRLVRSAAAAGVAAGAVAGLEAILAGDATDILPGR